MKKAAAIISAAILLMNGIFCVSSAEADIITAPVTDASFAADELSLYKNALELGPERFSDFNFSADYTVKKEEKISLVFGAAPYKCEKLYDCNFNSGETLGIADGNGEIKNTNNSIVLKGADWLKTQELAENIRDIDLSFDFAAWHEWTNFRVYLRGGQLMLNICSRSAAGDNKRYLVLKNAETGSEVFYDKPVQNGRIRIYAVSGSVNVFLDDKAVINYAYPTATKPKSGAVYFTVTECEVTLDNIDLFGGCGEKEAYNCDFSGGETLGIADGGGKIENENGKIILQGSNWLRTNDIATDTFNFELSFDAWVNHDWTNSFVCMRGGQLTLNIRGRLAAGNDKGCLILKNNSTDESLLYGESISGKRIRVSATGKKVEVYADEKRVFDYSYPETCNPESGEINFTATECTLALDNIKLSVTDDADLYRFEPCLLVNIGERITLTEKRTDGETELASGGVLDCGSRYNLRVIRLDRKITVYANGTLIFTENIAPKYADAYLKGQGMIGIYSSADGSHTENVRLYNSAELEIRASYAEMLPIANNVPSDFAIAAQSVPNGDAAVSADREKEVFGISSPSALNAWAKTSGFFENAVKNVYVRFDVRNSRPDWSYDTFYFGGYEFHFDCGISPDAPWVSDGENNLICSSKYKSYGVEYYTLEFIKSDDTVTVYYYPAGGERELFFSGGCIDNKTNLTVKKQQGRLDFKNFVLYGGCPARFEAKQGAKEGADISFLSDGYGALPFKTTLARFKSRMLNGNKITAYINGRRLSDEDYIYTGTEICYEGYSDKWRISTVADLDGNGKIDVSDLYNAERIRNSRAAELTDTYSKSADTDHDGIVTEKDIALIRKSILGGNISKCEKNGNSGAASGGRQAAEPGDTALITVSLRDYSAVYGKTVAALQAELCWNGEKAEYIHNSLSDLSGAEDFEIYYGTALGKFIVLYEPNSGTSSITKGTENLFSFELEIPNGASGGSFEVRLTGLTAVFGDGTVLPLISDARSGFDILEEGVNKFTRAGRPTLAFRDENTVLLNKVYGCEYSTNGIDWQEEPLFNGLSVGTEYSFYQRYAAHEGMYAGNASEPLTVTLYLRGDVDRSGTLNSADLCFLRKILLGIYEGGQYDADVDRNGKTDIIDLIKLKHILAEKD